ncbi:MAG: type II toxin-antitoxin system PemK/MazF family toxin [Candidatus Aenigmarchaeota archaeon]|nr:type II toxin-antitoxin system PemK/MazF family toxin [Candidatus Aenigmarchaeota archaeon]MDI6722309.1 type II toxin-antitoxin system PemK/MazF family toxin [Candidatus Aenigmarchaeota archaeon]
MQIKRGDIILVNLDPVVGSEQGKTRPAVVIQNDIGNEYSPTTIVAPVTSKIFSRKFPTNVEVGPANSPLKEECTILLNQIRTIDKSRIIRNYGRISAKKIKEVDDAIMNSLGLDW